MKNLYIVANWKANMTQIEANNWLSELQIKNYNLSNKEIIICPPYHLLYPVHQQVMQMQLPLSLGSQDVSQYGRGAYTGEQPASLLSEYIKFCIVGHSERREKFHETDTIIAEKASLASASNLLPILCVQGADTSVPKNVKFVAYEPVFAIGSGTSDTPENAEIVAKEVRGKDKDIMYVLYGGSVTAENVASFTKMEHINGVLVGKASLDPQEFSAIIQNA